MKREKVILIVEDDKELRESLARRFAKRDFKVFTAEGGIEGLKIIHREVLDVLLTDIRMPKGSGITLIEEVRAILGKVAPVIICMSAFSDFTEGGTLLPGIDAFLPKPLDSVELFAAVDRFYNARLQRLSGLTKDNS